MENTPIGNNDPIGNNEISPLCERLKQYKFKTPPWKETFRKDCLERLRQNRRKLIDHNRHICTNDVVDEGWIKLREQYGDVDSYLVIYDEIRKEIDEEAERIAQEYERSFPPGNDVQVPNEMDCSSTLATPSVLGGIVCSMCGKRNNYGITGLLPRENLETEFFCDCGHLLVDRRTKVLEPSISKQEVMWRLNEATTRHALVCAASPAANTVDGGMNDGTQLVVSCQVCGMQLLIW